MSVRLPFCFIVCPEHKKIPVWKQKKARKMSVTMLMVLVKSVIWFSCVMILGKLEKLLIGVAFSELPLLWHYTSNWIKFKGKNGRRYNMMSRNLLFLLWPKSSSFQTSFFLCAMQFRAAMFGQHFFMDLQERERQSVVSLYVRQSVFRIEFDEKLIESLSENVSEEELIKVLNPIA